MKVTINIEERVIKAMIAMARLQEETAFRKTSRRKSKKSKKSISPKH